MTFGIGLSILAVILNLIVFCLSIYSYGYASGKEDALKERGEIL